MTCIVRPDSFRQSMQSLNYTLEDRAASARSVRLTSKIPFCI